MAIRDFGWLFVAPVLAGNLFLSRGVHADSGLVSFEMKDAGSSSSEVLIKRESPGDFEIKYPAFDLNRGDVVEAPFVHTPRKTDREIKELSEYPQHLLYLYLTGLAPRESLEELERNERELLARRIADSYYDGTASIMPSSDLFGRMYETRYTYDKLEEIPSSKDIGALVDFFLAEGFLREGFVARGLGEFYDLFYNLSRLKVDVRLDKLFNDLKDSDNIKNRNSFSSAPNWMIVDKFHLKAELDEICLSLLTAQQRKGPWKVELGAFIETGIFDRF